MKKTEKRLICLFLSVLMSLTGFSAITSMFAVAENPVCVSFRSLDDMSNLEIPINTGFTSTTAETENYLEGTGAVKWTAGADSSNGTYWNIYCPNKDTSSGIDITGADYLTFDIYISDITKWNCSTGDKQVNIANKPDPWKWNNNCGQISPLSDITSWHQGWNHVAVKFTKAGTSSIVYGIRMFSGSGTSVSAGFYTIIDDVCFVNEDYLNSQAYADKLAAKDVSAKINEIGTVTVDSGDAITTARNAYEALTVSQKALVATYRTLTAAEIKYEGLTIPFDVQFRSLDDSQGVSGDGVLKTIAGETLNYVEGAGATRWTANEGKEMHWFFYAPDTNNGMDVSKSSYITFDIYISDSTKWAVADSGDYRIACSDVLNSWNTNAGQVSAADTKAMMKSLETGWNHVTVPFTPGSDAAKLINFRIYTTNTTTQAGFYTIIDDVCFVNQLYLDSQEYADKIAAKDVSAIINSIGTVTVDSGDVITTARNAYEALTADQKLLVATYNTLTTAEEDYEELTSNPICVSFRSLDDALNLEIPSNTGFTSTTAENGNYLEGTGAVKWTANADSIGGTYWNIYCPDKDTNNGIDITGADYLIFDIYISDITKWNSSAGDKQINIANKPNPWKWNNNCGQISPFSAITSWHQGWNHVAVKFTNTGASTVVYGIRMFSSGGTSVNAGFYTIIDDVCFVNEDYLNSRAYADKLAAKDVSALINVIGTVNLESKNNIDCARAAYDALTSDQKVLVATYDTLTNAEARYNELITNFNIQFRSLDDGQGVSGDGVLKTIAGETLNYVEGAGATRWTANEGKEMHWFFYAPDTNTGMDVSRASYITFDIYISDSTKWAVADSGDYRIACSDVLNSWNTNAGQVSAADTKAMMKGLKTGWNHVRVPFTPGSDAAKLINFRIYTTDTTTQAGFYTIIDDVCFVSQAYLDSQEYADKIAAKDVSALINSIGTVTVDSGDAITAARNAYEALTTDNQRNFVATYNTLLSAEDEYNNLTTEPVNIQFRSLDECKGVNGDGAIKRVEAETDNYIEGSGAVKWTTDTDKNELFWYFYADDTNTGVDISDATYLTFDIYINDISKLTVSDSGDYRIALSDVLNTWNNNAGEVNANTTKSMMKNLKTGWNHVVVPFTPGTTTKLINFRIYSVNSSAKTGFYSIVDDICFVNEKYLESQAYANKLAAKDVSALINEIGTVTDESGPAIETARSAFDSLANNEVKIMVVKYDTLKAAEKAYNDIQDVISKIDAIGTVTLESEAAIIAARTAYDALSSQSLKSQINNYATLTNAEKTLADLKAVADVISKIDAIGTVTIESKTKIDTARTAYNALSETLRELVTNYSVLTKAEKDYDDLVKYGDIDGDGEVTAKDALLALQYSVKKIELTDIQIKAADVDGKNGVSANDALLILQYSVNKIDSFPVENS